MTHRILIATIVGARPQFVKAATVSRLLRTSAVFHEILIHTGQHYDDNLSNVFFEELRIPTPDYDLDVGSGRHGAQTGRMLEAVESALLEARPDVVVVYGDTNSTLAGAVAAAKLDLPVAHVEAGLRSFNRQMPEEINRVVTDHVSTILCAPTEIAVKNLRREGIPKERVHLVGDVMYDAALLYAVEAEQRSTVLSRLSLEPHGYILATVHRAENTDDVERLRAIVEGLSLAAEEIPVVLPLHPRTRGFLEHAALAGGSGARLHIINPVGYLDMVMLERNARLVATDSGGLQKEAFFYEVPCVTLREEAEWIELVTLGWNRLVPPTSAHAVLSGVLAALDTRGRPGRPYGDGSAAMRILELLEKQCAG